MPQPSRLKPWMFVSAAWIVPAILGAVDQIGQNALWGGKLSLAQVLFTSFDWLAYGVLTPFVFLLSRRFPLSRQTLPRNAVIHVVFSILFCVLWASIGTVLKISLQPIPPDGSVLRWWLGWIFTTLPFGAAVYLAMVGIEHAIRYFIEAREREAQVARLSEQLTSAKLAALQANLNPHFLFNSLNTVAVLVRDGDAGKATRVIEQLSDVLRTTLSRSRDAEVSLEDELDLVRQYLSVEQARFSDRMRVSIDVPDALLSAAIPGFALQHLVENAVRHGIARRTSAGNVQVAARRAGDTLEITVVDDGVGIDEAAAIIAGHGIENTRERLRTLYGDRASLDVMRAPEQGTVARLRIPYHEVLLETGASR
jgi:signal transduction histidine kinase